MKDQKYLLALLNELRKLSKETEWVEFKHNNCDPKEIGEYISALANSAALAGKGSAYLVWGIESKTHDILGTSFDPNTAKKGNEDLENWLQRLLAPRISFCFHEIDTENGKVVLLEIDRATHRTVQFMKVEYVRIGSYKKSLKDFPEKERQLWKVFETTPFEDLPAMERVSSDEVLKLLNYPSYFELTNLPLPDNKTGILDCLLREGMVKLDDAGTYSITNLGAILFAKKIDAFKSIKRKAVRVVVYKGTTRYQTKKEQLGGKGYASGFNGLIDYINGIIPRNEIIVKALRKDVPMYPEIAIRELVANAVIHQDFFVHGAGPMIEIFSDRIEITNPGIPLVEPARFLNSPPHSRNESLASFMRRVGFCEERGSGVDKVVFQTEFYQLPAPLFEVDNRSLKATLFSHRPISKMDRKDRVRATYLHACLKYVKKEFLTNSSLRERFGIAKENSAMVSRIIRDALEDGAIKPVEKGKESRKHAKYVPYWL